MNDRITCIHSLFNELHDSLGKYATRHRNDQSDQVVALRSQLDALHHDFANLVDAPR